MLLLFTFIQLSAQQCRQDEDDPYDVIRTEDENGYVAEDVIRKNAAAEWENFKEQSYKQIDLAEKEISNAMDLLDEPGFKNRLQLELQIFEAEGVLEQLCEKLSRGERFDGMDLSDENIEKMKHYMADYRRKEAKLSRAIEKLRSNKR